MQSVARHVCGYSGQGHDELTASFWHWLQLYSSVPHVYACN